MASWLRNWGRSPRQDRRVVVDGKFVELTKPVVTPVVQEQPESALELVTEATDGQAGSAGETVVSDQPAGSVTNESRSDQQVDRGDQGRGEPAIVPALYSIPQEAEVVYVPEEHESVGELHILPMPPIPAAAWEFIEEAQKASQLLSGASEVPTGPDVLDGKAGRDQETVEPAAEPSVAPEAVPDSDSELLK